MSWFPPDTPCEPTAAGWTTAPGATRLLEFFAYETLGYSVGDVAGLARTTFGREVRRPRFTRVRREAAHD